MVEWFCEESKTYEPSKVRELPDWALQIFSAGMIAQVILIQKEN